LRTLRLHKDTPNFEVMMWKEMMIMDEQALEAQDVAELAAQEVSFYRARHWQTSF
ncbi:hypothetical protein EDB85DRAFT_1865353, partial [Lactarius pseudohatsudake]